MTEKQYEFERLFQGFSRGLRGGFMPRDWHTEVTTDYSFSVSTWSAAHPTPAPGERHVFTIMGGTGSGKTQASGHLASFMLNHRHVRWVVIVCPNRSILRRTRKVYQDNFGIHIDAFNKATHRRGIGSMTDGYITTYQKILSNPSLHRQICGPEFLVIFDEVHHLGEKPGWGAAAEEAFGRIRFMVCLTGTPYRSDNTKIPFVTYEPTERHGIWRFTADFIYPLGRAVAEEICRKPAFFYHDATVKIRTDDDSGYRVIDFRETLDRCPQADFLAGVRLRGAVSFGSTDRKAMLADALFKVRAENRKVIVFLGGDTESDRTPTEDAQVFLPSELQELGYTEDDYEVVTGDSPDAHARIEAFGASKKWILVTINMVSEGVDIPELSAAVFLTSITAKQTTIQRIGRVLRLMGPADPHKEAWIFLFRDKWLYEISDEIEREIQHEARVAKARLKADARSGDADSSEKRYRTEATGVGDGQLVEIKVGTDSFKPEEFDAVRSELRSLDLPSSFLHCYIQLKMGRAHGHS